MVDDLVGRSRIASFSISPNGKQVAFLTLKADPRKDDYIITLRLENTTPPKNLETLAQYRLAPENVYDASTHSLYKTVSQYVWSRDSTRILYTLHVGNEMQIRVRTIGADSSHLVLAGHEGFQIEENIQRRSGWRIISFDRDEKHESIDQPNDYALRMQDGFRPYKADNPKVSSPFIVRSWEFAWSTLRIFDRRLEHEVDYDTVLKTRRAPQGVAQMWIFGYGSLMWDNWECGYGCSRKSIALLGGYRRTFNKASTKNRGTKKAPCPTLNLEKRADGTCKGMAFEFPDKRAAEVLHYLAKREGEDFQLELVSVRLDDDTEVQANVPVYRGKNLIRTACLEEMAVIVCNARGTESSCEDYVKGIAELLANLKIHDLAVTELWQEVQRQKLGNRQNKI